MADSNAPFSVRMEQEDKQKLLQLIQESGKSNKDFMSVLLNAYELNKTKVEIPDIAKDIEGLEALTKQINEYYVNMGKRIENIRKSKDIEFTKELEVYKNRIETLKAENDKLNGDYEGLQQSYNNINTNYKEYKKQLEQLQQSLKDKNLLVEEYKEKNGTITGLLNEYKQYKTEVEEYKELLADSQTKNIELNNSIKEKDSTIEKLNNEVAAVNQAKETTVQELNSKHDEVIETIKEKAEIQKDKVILELKQEHQKVLEDLNIKHSKKIEAYQNKYKELLEQMEQTKKVTHKRTTGEGIAKGAKQ